MIYNVPTALKMSCFYELMCQTRKKNVILILLNKMSTPSLPILRKTTNIVYTPQRHTASISIAI